LAAGDRLFLFDSNYQILEEIESDGTGGFKFVLLSPEDYALEKQLNKDESMLSLDISGMFARSGRSNLGGVEIVLQDASGETIAKAFTNSQGHFSFEQVRPDEAYRIKSNVVDPNSEIRIFNDRGEVLEVIKPDPEGAYVYVRLKDTDRVITITNEKNIKIKVEEDEKFNLPHIYFASDRAVLTDNGIAVLERLRKILDENPHVSIDLAGHTDSKGALEYNLMLSEMRIESVKSYLVEHGVSSSRISGKGYGELQPVNHCVDGVECTEEEHAANRRTEIRFYSANKP
jgi:outer membrane protein OmpA-like peptidoglycan-associated protein